ncbi:hypothetical protein MMPV_002124 [Pyropia vietnamensis]
MAGGGRPDRGEAVGVAAAASAAVLLVVTVTVWGLLQLMGTSLENPPSSLDESGSGRLMKRTTTIPGTSASLAAATEAVALGTARRQRPVVPPPAVLLFVGADSVRRAARAKASAAAAAVEAGRAAGDWGAGRFAGRVFAAPIVGATLAGGAVDVRFVATEAVASAVGAPRGAAAPDWTAVEMVAVGRHIVRVITRGEAVWATAAAAPSRLVTVVVAETDALPRWATVLRLLSLGGGCDTIGEVLVHVRARVDEAATADDNDAVTDVVHLLNRQLFRRGQPGGCATAGKVAAVVPPPPPVVLPAPDPFGDPPSSPANAATSVVGTLPTPVVHYAMLSGAATFASRIPAVAASWLPGIPPGDVVIYTDALPSAAAVDTLPEGVAVTVTAPAQPDAEPNLARMSAWSHLTRVRDAWDHTLASRPDITHLVLVDDDTFVFPGAMPAVVGASKALANSSGLAWGGSLEMARVDNGDGRDGGTFAVALRAMHVAAGGEPCTLPYEVATNHTIASAGKKSTGGAHPSRVSGGGGNDTVATPRPPRSCADTFCSRCPAVPQGAAIVLTRALVAALRPVAGACETATVHLCPRCGSQRLYFCIHRVATLVGPIGDGGFGGGGRGRQGVVGATAPAVATVALPGVRRDTWPREPIGGSSRAVTFHAFERVRRLSVTGSMCGDMRGLADLARHRSGGIVSLQDVADALGCPKGGRWVKSVGKGKMSNGTCEHS